MTFQLLVLWDLSGQPNARWTAAAAEASRFVMTLAIPASAHEFAPDHVLAKRSTSRRTKLSRSPNQ